MKLMFLEYMHVFVRFNDACVKTKWSSSSRAVKYCWRMDFDEWGAGTLE